MAAGFTDDGLGALDAALAKHVEGGGCCGRRRLLVRRPLGVCLTGPLPAYFPSTG